MTRSFRFHASNYAWAELAAALAGLISFPILTRLLSVADYGAMNLVASVLGLTVALGKMGIQHAVVRSWPEVAAGRAPHDAATFRATVFWGMTATGTAVTLAWLLAAWLIPGSWWAEPHIDLLMMLAAPLILVRVIDSLLSNQLRAEEASGAMAIYGTARRYLSLAVVVAVLWFVRHDLQGFYLATLAVELLAIGLLAAWKFRRDGWPRVGRVSWPLFGSLALFGVPMLGSELSTVVLLMSDRFIIQTRLDAEQLGIYSAAFNMCDQLRNALLGAMVGAAYPRCMHLWEREGRAGLERFLQAFMHLYVLLALYLVALMAAVGGDLMVVLASAKYAAAGALTGWLMAGLALQSVLTIAAVGIYLARRTLLAMALVLVAGLSSLVANLLLVPWLGILGAAVALLVVSLALLLSQMAIASRLAPVVFPGRALLKFGAAAWLAWALARHAHTGSAWTDLLVQGVLLTGIYAAAVLLVDSSSRARVLQAWHGWRQR